MDGNARTIAGLYGNDTRAWVGKRVTSSPRPPRSDARRSSASAFDPKCLAERSRPMLPRDGFLHFSTLKHMARSPAHYREACVAPFEPTPVMRLGTLVH
jgi:hypothetical protein